MPGLRRSVVWTVAGAIIFNLLLFILSAQYVFLANVHHHWVLPWTAAALSAELLCAEFIPMVRRSSVVVALRNTLLSLLLFSCLIGLCRFQTIFACYMHCAPKLAAMLGIGGAVFVWGSYRYQKGHGLALPARGIGCLLIVLGVLVLVIWLR